jgi:hypothetical protein
MQLIAKTHNNTYPFEVILFDDPKQEEFNFLIIMPDKATMLAEKKFPSGKWQPGSNSGAFCADLQDAMFDAIDNANFATIAEKRRPIEELNKFYIDNISGIG